jgi:hypothetical protein
MLGRMQEWQPDLDVTAPEWLTEGVRVRHATFGDGTVGRVGTYKDVPTVWIDFDRGETKALALEFGLAHLTPVPRSKRRRWFGGNGE